MPGLVLNLGRVSDSDITQVNSNLVGSTNLSNDNRTWKYFIDRKYFIPKSVLVDGENTVTIRIQSQSFGKAGFVDGIPSVRSDWSEASPLVSDFLPSIFALLIVLLLSVLDFKNTTALSSRRSLIIVGTFVSLLQLFNSFYLYRADFLHAVLWLKLHFVVTVLGILFIFRFISKLSDGIKVQWPLWLTLLFVVICSLCPGVGANIPDAIRIAYLFGVWGIITVLYSFYLILSVFGKYLKNRDKYLFPVICGGAILIVFGGYDIIMLLEGVLPVAVPASGIGFMVFLLSGVFSLLALDRTIEVGELKMGLAEAKTKLGIADKESALGATIRQVAHDLRTPIAVIRVLTSEVEDKFPNSPENTLLQSVLVRMNDIVHSLTNVSNDKVEVNLLECIRTISAELGVRLAEKRIKIDLNVDNIDAWYDLNVSPIDLQRVVSNLVINAAEASADGAMIQVKIRRTAEAAIVLEVNDRGTGIPDSIISKIFDKDFTFGKKDGTGLGLFL